MGSPAETAAGDGAPLLPTNYKGEKDGDASVPGAVFNVSTSIIGAGIMSIPATLKVLGVLPAFALMLIVAFLADLSVEFLLRYTYSGDKRTYAGVMGESFGRVGSVLVQVFVMMLSWGCLIVYLIIIGDVLSGNHQGESLHLGVLQEWFGPQWWTSRPYAILFLLIFVLLPLVLYRRVESLRFSSAISVLLALAFVSICSVMAITAFIQGKTHKPRLLPRLNGQGSFFELFTAGPVIVTAFTFHFNVHPISSELGKQSKMTKATRISVLLCAAIYFGVGISGYLLFGDSIASDILVNFDRSSESPFLNDVVRLSYALHLVLVFPLLNFSLRGNMDELFCSSSSSSSSRRRRVSLAGDDTRFLSFTFVILALTYVAAIAIPDIWIFFQYVGSTAAVSLSLIFPAAITLRDVRGISSTKDKFIAGLMVILAVATSGIAIATNIVNIRGNS